MLLGLIPVFHVLAAVDTAFDRWLSGIVAVESILASIKVWYFAQPYQNTGALVLMINHIVRDCIAFLFLAFVVLFGFALALHVLFRGLVEESSQNCSSDPCHVQESDVIAGVDAFGSCEGSLAKLLFALLGAFEPEVLRLSGSLSWLITAVFVAYLIAETIVLLNLLIAIVGDTFDRAKGNEEAHMLMMRAKFIDDREAALSEVERGKMERQIGKYVFVLEDKDFQSDSDSSAPWMGRVAQIECSVRVATKDTPENLDAGMANNTEKVLQLQEANREKAQGDQTRLAERLVEVQQEQQRTISEQRRVTEDLEILKSSAEAIGETTVNQMETLVTLFQNRHLDEE